MLAMDVVDTLRHQESLATKELDDDARKAELVERLKRIYAGQGIAVPDAIVAAGVKALEESRFVYTPTPPSLARTLALLWVDRRRWGLAAGAVALALVLGIGSYSYFVVGGARRTAEAARIEITETLPANVAKLKRTALDEAVTPEAKARVGEIAGRAEAALARRDVAAVKAGLTELDSVVATLRDVYQIRIVTRPGERSGVWRQPPSKSSRNYYLVVEAVGADGRVQPRSITNEEDQTTTTVTKWGQRVPQSTYDTVARDKQDDGIIQMTRLGEKRRGDVDVRWTLPVQTGAITKW
ncbi:hypothetical protein EYW49_15205 [Siculibacillus lacustris]|uniref:Uncharacterized protein n=2 Tax=Siculibacillus lacustris TaxID=1549641 RepID=A0A4Q9VKR2_9HYPH|nr:hypothetical protein EYW49_15205 [Siculibacillus lacustris]